MNVTSVVQNSTPLLIDETPLQFLPSLAKALGGTNEALLLQQLHFLCKITEKSRNHTHYQDGKWWVYNSYEEWHEEYFSWISVPTIKRLFLWFEKQNLVLSRPKIQGRSKVGKWYTVNYNALQTFRIEPKPKKKGQIDPTPYQNDTGTSLKMIHPRMSQNDPSNKSETTTETTFRENGGGTSHSNKTSGRSATVTDFQLITSVITEFSQTLQKPFINIPDMTRQIVNKQLTSRDVSAAVATCQDADNPAGAFVYWVKNGVLPQPRTRFAKPKAVSTSPYAAMSETQRAALIAGWEPMEDDEP